MHSAMRMAVRTTLRSIDERGEMSAARRARRSEHSKTSAAASAVYFNLEQIAETL
jgi:hypothetical protein